MRLALIGAGFIVGVVGALQFEVLASRIEQEYSLPVRFEPSQFTSARWITGPSAMGSEKGTPSATTSAPPRAAASTRRRDSARSGSPVVK